MSVPNASSLPACARWMSSRSASGEISRISGTAGRTALMACSFDESRAVEIRWHAGRAVCEWHGHPARDRSRGTWPHKANDRALQTQDTTARLHCDLANAVSARLLAAGMFTGIVE